MGRVAAVLQRPDSFGNAFQHAFAQAMAQAQQEQQNKAMGQMYFDMMKSASDQQVAPYSQYQQKQAENATLAQMIQNSNSIANSAPQQNLMTPEISQALRDVGVNDIPQTVNPAIKSVVNGQPATQQNMDSWQNQSASNVGRTNAENDRALQMLASAKERYGTAMFEKLAPIVESGKVPYQAVIKLVESQIAKAEQQAQKMAMSNAIKTLSDSSSTTEQKQGILAQLMIDNPAAANGLAKAFGLTPTTGSFAPNGTAGYWQGGQFIQTGPVGQYAPPKEPKQPHAPTVHNIDGVANQWDAATNTWKPLGNGGEGGLTKGEKDAISRLNTQISDVRSKYWLKDSMQGTAGWAENTPPDVIKNHDAMQNQISGIMKGAEGRRLTVAAVNDLGAMKAKGIPYETILNQIVTGQESMKAKGVDPLMVLRALNNLFGKNTGNSNE